MNNEFDAGNYDRRLERLLCKALEQDHPCEDRHCDIGAAMSNELYLWAGHLLQGATECPRTDAVLTVIEMEIGHLALERLTEEERDELVGKPHVKCHSCQSVLWLGEDFSDSIDCSDCLATVVVIPTDKEGAITKLLAGFVPVWCSTCGKVSWLSMEDYDSETTACQHCEESGIDLGAGCEAVLKIADDWHGGQWSDLYKIGCIVRNYYKESPIHGKRCVDGNEKETWLYLIDLLELPDEEAEEDNDESSDTEPGRCNE